jgi:hypothetical protein
MGKMRIDSKKNKMKLCYRSTESKNLEARTWPNEINERISVNVIKGYYQIDVTAKSHKNLTKGVEMKSTRCTGIELVMLFYTTCIL